MGHQGKIKIVEVYKVEPSNRLSIITAPKHLPLTFFDLRYLRLPLVKRVYFFKTWSFDVIPRLKQSLSLALRHFLPLAGNLVWPESSTVPFVRYLEGDGVLFSVAEPGPDLDFKFLSSRDVASKSEDYTSLVPDLAGSYGKAATVAVQVTIFPEEGFSLGVTLHHAVLDGRSVHMFVKSGPTFAGKSLDSKECSPLLPAELTPSFDRTDMQDPCGIREIFARNWMSIDGPGTRSLMMPKEENAPQDLIRGTFTLNRRDIEKIRLMVPSKTRKSTFCLASAYLWVSRIKAETIRSGDSKSMLGFAGDCRSRLEPPLPMNYFGNCAITIAVAKEKDLALDWREGLDSAMNSIVEGVKNFKGEKLLSGAEDWVIQWTSVDHSTAEVSLYFVAGSPQFQAYAADFGWGRPMKTDMVSLESARAILVQDARDGDGIEFMVSLKKPEYEDFSSLFRQGLECS